MTPSRNTLWLTHTKGKGNPSRQLHPGILLRDNVAHLLRRDLFLPRPSPQHRVQTPDPSNDKEHLVLHGND